LKIEQLVDMLCTSKVKILFFTKYWNPYLFRRTGLPGPSGKAEQDSTVEADDTASKSFQNVTENSQLMSKGTSPDFDSSII